MAYCKRCGFKSFRAAREQDGLCLYCLDHPEGYLTLFTKKHGRGIGGRFVDSLESSLLKE